MIEDDDIEQVRVKCPECGHLFITHAVGDACVCEECDERFRRFPAIVSGPGDEDPREIVCLVGSREADRVFLSEKERLTLDGAVVFTPGVYGRVTSNAEVVDDIHREKIRMADRVHVITDETDLDRETSAQIAFARRHDKEITYRSGRKPVR